MIKENNRNRKIYRASILLLFLFLLLGRINSCEAEDLEKKQFSFHDEKIPACYISEYNSEEQCGGKVRIPLSYSLADGCDVSFQWFRCDNLQGTNPVEVDNGQQVRLKIRRIDKPQVQYYFCVATVISAETGDIPETYQSAVFTVAYTGLPTVYLDVYDGASVKREEYRECRFRVSDSEEYGPGFESEAVIKGRGNSSWQMPKKGYNIKFLQKTELFGLGADKKWTLIANYPDKTLLRNWLVSGLTKEVLGKKEWEPSYIHVDLVLNGKYAGNYTITESVKIGKNRVDIKDVSKVYDAMKDGKKEGNLRDGGFIIEFDNRDQHCDSYLTTCWNRFIYKDPETDEFDSKKRESLEKYINAIVQRAEDAMVSASFTDSEEGYRKYLDVDSFVDWYIIHEMIKNNDSNFLSSVFMYYDPEDGKLHMGPNWDLDVACGNIDNNGNDDPEGLWVRQVNWFTRLFEDDYFSEKVRQRWNENRERIIDFIQTDLFEKEKEIRVSADADNARWHVYGRKIYADPAGYENRTTYQAELAYLRDWMLTRIDWLDRNCFHAEE